MLSSESPREGGPSEFGPALSAGGDSPPRASAELVSELVVAMLISCGIGFSLALAVYGGLHFGTLDALLTKNTLDPAQRMRALRFALLGASLFPFLASAFLAWRRSAASVYLVGTLARLGSPLLLAFALPSLLRWQAFLNNELLLVVSLTGFGLLLERLLRVSFTAWQALPKRSAQSEPREPSRVLTAIRGAWRKVVPRLPLGLTVATAAFGFVYFGYYTILHHYRLQTSSWDLAIFDNMMWNLLRGEWFFASPDLGRSGSHIQYHATFVAYLFLPFYALRQQADMLLALQALLVGSATIPLFLLVKVKTGSAWTGLLLSVAYLLHGPLHGPVFYDFHFLTTAPFFVWWLLYFFETGRTKALVVMWIVTLSVREDVSACLSAAALFLLVSRQRPWWAFFGGLGSAIYFVAMKFGIMPLHRAAEDKETFTWMFKDLVAAGSVGYGGVLKTIATNPLYALNATLESEKLGYLLRMFGPVLLLPLRSAKPWILFLPAALFTLLSSGYKPLYQTYFQYTSNWTPYLFFGTAVVLAQLGQGAGGRVRQRAALTALAFSAVLFSYHHGAVLRHDNFRGGFRKVVFEYSPADSKRYRDLVSLIREIPPKASVAATETEAPHVSNRKFCFTMRFGYLDADYLLLSIAEAKAGPSRKHFTDAVNSGQYGFVRQSGDFMLWQRGAAQDRNAQGLALIGTEPKARRKK